jgi:hypothetical protein
LKSSIREDKNILPYDTLNPGILCRKNCGKANTQDNKILVHIYFWENNQEKQTPLINEKLARGLLM